MFDIGLYAATTLLSCYAVAPHDAAPCRHTPFRFSRRRLFRLPLFAFRVIDYFARHAAARCHTLMPCAAPQLRHAAAMIHTPPPLCCRYCCHDAAAIRYAFAAMAGFHAACYAIFAMLSYASAAAFHTIFRQRVSLFSFIFAAAFAMPCHAICRWMLRCCQAAYTPC